MYLTRAILFAALLLSSLPSAAALISLIPSEHDVVSGETFNLDVQISGLLPDQVVQLFDIQLLFDPAIFGLTSSVFGSGLGEGIDSYQEHSGLNFYEYSLLWDDELKLLQGSGFTLLTLTFNALAPVTDGSISLAINAFGLLDFNQELIDADVAAAQLSVRAPLQTIASPSTASLLVLMLCIVAVGRRRTRHIS